MQEKTVAGWGHEDAMQSTDGLLALLWVIIAIAVTARMPRAAAATCPQPSDAVRRCKCSSRDNEIQIWWVWAILIRGPNRIHDLRYVYRGTEASSGIGQEEGWKYFNFLIFSFTIRLRIVGICIINVDIVS